MSKHIKEKLAKLSTPRNKSARPVLIYEGELAPSVETEGFFDSIIPFRVLLRL